MNDHQKNHATSQDDNTKSTPSKNSKHIKIKLWHFILVILGIILLTSIITVVSTILISHQKSGLNKEQRANLKKIEYVYQTLNKDYYKKQSSDKLTQSAIDGMVKELKDPYVCNWCKDEWDKEDWVQNKWCTKQDWFIYTKESWNY